MERIVSNPRLKRLTGAQRAVERYRLWIRLMQRNTGSVPCFVCGEHVRKREATLEHIIPLSKGGADAPHNYAISHAACNALKADRILAHRVKGGAS